MRHPRLALLVLLATAGATGAQPPAASKDDRITPEKLGLPKGSTRTSEPFITRIYKTDDGGEILRPQPKEYPFPVKSDYTLKENEKPRVHEGLDLGQPLAHSPSYAL